MNLNDALLWGFLATVLLTATLAASQGIGWSRISIPFILGTMFTPDRNRATTIGLLVHFFNGWLFAFVYVLVFESMHRASWWLGAAGGFLHGLFVLLIVLPTLPAFHPRMATESYGPTPTRMLQPPGFLALHYGRHTPLATLVAHVGYGALLGGFYHLMP
jgi:uncharacterized membrane protein YagU involved in acid resistance